MHNAVILRQAIVGLFGCLVLLAEVAFAETPGEHFEKAMKRLAENCAKAKLRPGETGCDPLKLKPADPLATEEGRFAHSIKIPNPVSKDSGYKPGMTPQEYFEHLCKTEAGEFIYKTVENVEGIYMMRPRNQATDYHQEHLYALEDPFGYRDWEAEMPEKIFVRPTRYFFFEKPLPSSSQKGAQGEKYARYSGLDDKDPISMVEEHTLEHKSRYGYTWRGVSRAHDRELGIAGGELIILNLQTNEILAVRRGFIRSGCIQNTTGIWWLNGQVCSKEAGRLFYTQEFISNVLRPKNVRTEEREHADR
jgi:hypothetical protein